MKNWECLYEIPGFSIEDLKDVALLAKHFKIAKGIKVTLISNFQVLIKGKLLLKDDTDYVIQSPYRVQSENVLALTNCHFFYLDNYDYKKLRVTISNRVFTDSINFFLSLPIFDKWSKNAIRRIVEKSTVEEYKKGNMVYSIDEDPSYVYIVKSGEYELLATHLEKTPKQPFLEGFLGPLKEREKKRNMNARHSPNRRNIGSDFITKNLTFLVLHKITIAKNRRKRTITR